MVILVKFVFLVVIVCVGVDFYCVDFEWMQCIEMGKIGFGNDDYVCYCFIIIC